MCSNCCLILSFLHFPLQPVSPSSLTLLRFPCKASLPNNWVMALWRALPECCWVSQIWGRGGGTWHCQTVLRALLAFMLSCREGHELSKDEQIQVCAKQSEISFWASRAGRSMKDRGGGSCSEHDLKLLMTKCGVYSCSAPLMQHWCCWPMYEREKFYFWHFWGIIGFNKSFTQ